MPKRFGLCCALLALSTSALAQSEGPPRGSNPLCGTTTGRWCTCWRWAPRGNSITGNLGAGMVEAGARPGALLFRGAVANGQFAGTAFIFDRRCGPLPYAVSGPILDHDERVVLTGEAPLVGAKCRVQGHFTEVLEFRLQNANKTARALAPENAPSPALPTESAPRSRRRRLRRHRGITAPSPTPPAVAAEHAPAPKAAAAPPAAAAGSAKCARGRCRRCPGAESGCGAAAAAASTNSARGRCRCCPRAESCCGAAAAINTRAGPDGGNRADASRARAGGGGSGGRASG